MQEEIEKIKGELNDLRIQRARDFSHLDSEDGTTRRLLENTENNFYRVEKDLRGTIFGNGKIGMISEIHLLKENNKQLKVFVDELKAEVKSLNEYRIEQKGSIKVAMWFIGIGVAILVGIVITLATR